MANCPIGEISEEFEWKIKDFFSLNDLCYSSHSFIFAGESWHMTIYPNGRADGNDTGYVQLFLIKEYSGSPINYRFSFALKSVDRRKYEEREFEYCFKKKVNYGSLEWQERSKLLRMKTELVPSDTLTVVCSLKYPELSINSRNEKSSGSRILMEKKLLQDYKKLFMKKEECDVVIRVKEKEFPAHRNILAARSSVFESTFRNDMKEKETGIVNIEDCEPFSFADFLCFLYCGELETLSQDNVFSLFTTADKYDVQDLRDVCLKFLKENISIDTFCDTITLALQHSESELIKIATDFFVKHARKIVKTVPWQKFAANNFTQGNELVIKAFDAAAEPSKQHEDERTMAPNNNIQKESSAHLESKLIKSHTVLHVGSIKIFVKTLTGKSVTMEVQSSGTVDDIKAKFGDKTGFCRTQLTLIFEGRRLGGESKLSDCNIRDGSILHVIGRLRDHNRCPSCPGT